MKSFRFLAVSAAVLAFLLAVLGSWVRINGAGMTCPDWPLCKGSVVPLLEGGVVYEWSHRLVALIEGFVLIGAVVTGWRVRLRIAGLVPVLGALGVVFAAQVILGGVTVKLSNSPASVVFHWATAMILLAVLVTLAVLAIVQPQRAGRVVLNSMLCAIAASCALAAMCAGAYVSSSGAGLACGAVPGCGSSSFWGIGALQYAQMAHRTLAAIFAFAAVIATLRARTSSARAFAAAVVGIVLVCVQIALGIANVVYALPIDMREAHAANAAATFLAYVIAAVLAALDAPAVAALARGTSTFGGAPTRRLSGISR